MQTTVTQNKHLSFSLCFRMFDCCAMDTRPVIIQYNNLTTQQPSKSLTNLPNATYTQLSPLHSNSLSQQSNLTSQSLVTSTPLAQSAVAELLPYSRGRCGELV